MGFDKLNKIQHGFIAKKNEAEAKLIETAKKKGELLENAKGTGFYELDQSKKLDNEIKNALVPKNKPFEFQGLKVEKDDK